MEDFGKRKKVICPIEGRDGKVYWRQLGSAYVNKDSSINLYLDSLPLKFDGKLQVRDLDEPRKTDAPPQYSLRSVAESPAAGEELPF